MARRRGLQLPTLELDDVEVEVRRSDKAEYVELGDGSGSERCDRAVDRRLDAVEVGDGEACVGAGGGTEGVGEQVREVVLRAGADQPLIGQRPDGASGGRLHGLGRRRRHR